MAVEPRATHSRPRSDARVPGRDRNVTGLQQPVRHIHRRVGQYGREVALWALDDKPVLLLCAAVQRCQHEPVASEVE